MSWSRFGLIVGSFLLLGQGALSERSSAEQLRQTVHLKDGRVFEGRILKTDLNTMAVSRAAGGIRLMSNNAIAEMRFDPGNGDPLVFHFEHWINGAAKIERQGRIVVIEDWVEPDPAQVAAVSAKADTVPPDLSFSLVAGEEGGRPTLIQLKLSKPASAPISIIYTTSDGTATADADYKALAGVLTFEEGEQVRELEVPIVDDGLAEDAEFLKLIVNADPNFVKLNGNDEIMALIRDND